MRYFWRKELLDGARTLPERVRPIVPALLATGLEESPPVSSLAEQLEQMVLERGERVTKISEVLAACTLAERQAVWELCCPAVAAEVELAWTSLPVQVIARRQGGPSEDGDLFTWPLTEEEARQFRFDWLRKLLPFTAAFPQYGLLELLQREREIVEAHKNSSLPGYDSHTSSGLNGDPPGYVAVAVLDRADASAEALLQALLETIDRTEKFDVGVSTALLCTSWPKAWAAVDARLAAAPRDSRWQERLLTRRLGIHPGAWRHFLETAQRSRLNVRSYLSLRWRGLQATGEKGAAATLLKLQASASDRQAMLRRGNAPDMFFALFAEAVEDGLAALQHAMEVLEEKDPERRLAATWFLARCPEDYSHPRLVRLIDDDDFHVRAVAFSVLGDTYYEVYQEPIDPARLEAALERWPEPEPPPPRPWRPVKEAHGCATLLLVIKVPEGDEARLERWLPQLGDEASEWLVPRLNPRDHLRMLLRLARHGDATVYETAVAKLGEEPLSPEALAGVEELLTLRKPERRDQLIELLLAQPLESCVVSTRRLLASRSATQRLAGLELVRRMAGNDASRATAEELARALPLAGRASVEERQLIEEIHGLFSATPDVR